MDQQKIGELTAALDGLLQRDIPQRRARAQNLSRANRPQQIRAWRDLAETLLHAAEAADLIGDELAGGCG